MDLPFPVKQGEPITASNTNRTIGAVRWAVNKIQSTFPRAIPKGTSYKAPFQITVTEKDNGATWYIEMNEGWWIGRGHYPAKGCTPSYQVNTETGNMYSFSYFPEINPYNDAFWIPTCSWEIARPAYAASNVGSFRGASIFVFLADLSTDTGLVESHPKPYLTTSPVTSDSPFASATCLVPVAYITRESSLSNPDKHGAKVFQILASNAYYTAEYPLATQPFQFYRKSWQLNTFVCNGGLIRVRYPIGLANEFDGSQTEGETTEGHYVGLGGATTEEEKSDPEPKDFKFKEAWYYIEGVEISVTQENTGSLVSLVYTQAGDERGSGKWVVTDLGGIVPDADGLGGDEKEFYAQGKPIFVNYNIEVEPVVFSEWEQYQFPDNDNAVTAVNAGMGEDFTVQIPVAIMRKQKGSDVITCQQIACGVLTAEPQMQFNLRCSETIENNGQTESSQHSGTGSSTLQSGQAGTPVTEKASNALRVDVARFKLEQEELDRANTISGEEIGTE